MMEIMRYHLSFSEYLQKKKAGQKNINIYLSNFIIFIVCKNMQAASKILPASGWFVVLFVLQL
jgi:tRNA(Phe) wybutosine-synthesizing methylase Tyw3